MSKQIVVGLDGSALSETALPVAAVFARRQGSTIVLVRIVSADELPEGWGAAERYLEATARSLREQEIEVETVVGRGEAAPALVAEARTRRAELIILATHGRSGLGRWIYGSVADQVMRDADVPVVLVPPTCPAHWPRDQSPRIVVPLDGSILAMEALSPAERLARDLGAELVLVHVVVPLTFGYAYGYGDTPPYVFSESEEEAASARRQLADIGCTLRERGLAVTTRMAEGPAAATIAEVARAEGASLIVLASHGHGGVPRAVLGSVATGVVQRATTPVLVVVPHVRPGSIGETTATHLDGAAGDTAPARPANGPSPHASFERADSRRREIEDLGRTGGPAAAERLLELLRDNRDISSPAIVRALVHVGPDAVPALLATLRDPSDRIRWHSAEALARIRDLRATEPLVAALEDSDMAVRWNAARGLARLGRPALVALLRALATRPLSPWLAQGAERARREGIDARPTDRLQTLVEALHHPTASIEVPLRATEALDELEAELATEPGT